MSDTVRCPDCGHENPPGSRTCEACNYPLVEGAAPPPPPATAGPPETPAPVAPPPESAVPVGAGAASAGTPEAPGSGGPPIVIPRPMRRRRPRPAANQALSLWLLFGVFMAGVLLFYAFTGFQKSNAPPIEGSTAEQQKEADRLRAAIDRDSTDVASRIALADILYDTANWSEAIVHYRAAVRMDSSQTNALVDLGVSYYNLSLPDEAARHFELALKRDPHHPFALFNLGIISERREDWSAALGFYHRAAQSSPPEAMLQPLQTAMERVQQKSGRTAPPLP